MPGKPPKLRLLIITDLIMQRLPNIHPGEVLQEEFLAGFGISAYWLAQALGIPQTRVAAILKGKRRITADTALRLGRYFGNSPKFWLGLQDDYDLEEQQTHHLAELRRCDPSKKSLNQRFGAACSNFIAHCRYFAKQRLPSAAPVSHGQKSSCAQARARSHQNYRR